MRKYELPESPRYDRVAVVFFFLIMRRPPRSTLFPSTPLSRSPGRPAVLVDDDGHGGVRAAELAQQAPGRHRLRDEQRSEEHTSELQSRQYLVCRLLLEKKNTAHLLHWMTLVGRANEHASIDPL